jgi:nucleoside-diphosphate-sugar epimerase
MTVTEERFLVTGAHGCIGAWTIAELVREGTAVLGLDLVPGPGRAELLLEPDELETVRFVQADITEEDAVKRVVGEHGISHVVHLAGLQYPQCRDHHVNGARVNVIGTINVFEGVLANPGTQLAYASSLAALLDGMLYGAWKAANEATARAYWKEDGVPSIGLRPGLVYGVGRDQGTTSSMSQAMLAVALGERFHIVHGGSTPTQHGADMARLFIRAARAATDGAGAYSTGGEDVHMSEVVAAIRRAEPDAEVSYEEAPFAGAPDGWSSTELEQAIGPITWRSLDDGVAETIEHYRRLAERGLVSPLRLRAA